jgi:hypothetical protein
MAAGDAVLTFRRRGEKLSFERRVLPGTSCCDPATVADESTATVLEHRGHPVQLVRAGPTGLWDRFCGRHTCLAEWVCSVARRRFRVRITSAEPERLLQGCLERVGCHSTGRAGDTEDTGSGHTEAR